MRPERIRPACIRPVNRERSDHTVDPLASLRRIRWAVRAVLVLGVGASIAGNMLHAEDNPVSQAIAAWAPAALLITIELISKVPVHGRLLALARLAATALIAGIAAYVSYWHQVAVAVKYGEAGVSPYLLPLSVDGLVVVASICLVELADRVRAAQAPEPQPSPSPEPVPAQPQPPEIPQPAPQPVEPEIVRPAKPAPERRPQGVHERGGQLLRGAALREDAIGVVVAARGLVANAELADMYSPPLAKRTAETFGAAARKRMAEPTNGHRPDVAVKLS